MKVSILTNPCNNLEKPMYQFKKRTAWRIGKARQWSDLGLIKMGTKPVQIELMILTEWLWKISRKGSDVDPLRHPVCRQFEKCIHSWGGVVLRIHIYAANCAHSVSRGYADASIAWSIINAYCHLQLTELVVNTRSELRKFKGYDTSYILTILPGNQ